ncbi:hypothetical protein D3C80_1850900 [compost metagenome]
MPLPDWPNACIRALSSNSPTMRGCTCCSLSHRSKRLRTTVSWPGTSNGASCRQAGKGPSRHCANAGVAKKLSPHSPSFWL